MALKEQPNKKEKQRAASIDNILSCALRLFVKNGYRTTTIDHIAMEAGLTKGAVYFYFKTKNAIMLRLLEKSEEFVVDPIPGHLADAGPGADAKLVKFIHSQSIMGLTRPEHVLLLILVSIEFCGVGNEIEDKVKSIYRRMYEEIEGLIEKGQKEGVFRTDIGVRDLAAIVIAGHDGVLAEWYRRPKELAGNNLATALRTVLLNGVMKEGDC